MGCLEQPPSAGHDLRVFGRDVGVDVTHADFHWLEERRETLRGIVLTHGHEDHVGAVPYLLTGTLSDVDLALFESVSGFTTTGATVLEAGPDPTRYDASDGILFFRAISQWIGGMGVIALVIAVLPSVGSWGGGWVNP